MKVAIVSPEFDGMLNLIRKSYWKEECKVESIFKYRLPRAL